MGFEYLFNQLELIAQKSSTENLKKSETIRGIDKVIEKSETVETEDGKKGKLKI